MISSSNPQRAYKILDSRTLGRPMHLLGDFGVEFRRVLSEFFEAQFNRRNGPMYRVDAVRFVTDAAAMTANEWCSHGFDGATIAMGIDRSLLLSMLDFRYGGRRLAAAEAKGADAPAADDAAAEAAAGDPADAEANADAGRRGEALRTSSERRLQRNVSAALATFCAGRITASAEVPAASAAVQPTLVIECDIVEEQSAVQGAIRFSLDAVWQARLYAQLAGSLRTARRVSARGKPLASELEIRLTVELVDIDIEFGQLQRLKPGDVLPVRMRSKARVLAERNPVFSALIGERGGKLCLTSFELTE